MPVAACDYVRFGELWRELHPGRVGADPIDAQLHAVPNMTIEANDGGPVPAIEERPAEQPV